MSTEYDEMMYTYLPAYLLYLPTYYNLPRLQAFRT